MKILDRGASFAKRLSVFYQFTFVLLLFFGFFYYKYIPENQMELNRRGFRILNQLSSNVFQKNEDMDSTFGNFILFDQDSATDKEIQAQIGTGLLFEVLCMDSIRLYKFKKIDNLNYAGWYFIYNLQYRNDNGPPGVDALSLK